MSPETLTSSDTPKKGEVLEARVQISAFGIIDTQDGTDEPRRGNYNNSAIIPAGALFMIASPHEVSAIASEESNTDSNTNRSGFIVEIVYAVGKMKYKDLFWVPTDQLTGCLWYR